MRSPRIWRALAPLLSLLVVLPAALDPQSVGQSGRSNAGMVSAAQPLATEAGVMMLEMGGNAADAAALGLDISPVPRSGAFGRVHRIQYDPATNTWIGAADPDWEGAARGPRVARDG